ncbi:MAG: hypothetical protein QM705_04090 [Ancrocorticia sp.]
MLHMKLFKKLIGLAVVVAILGGGWFFLVHKELLPANFLGMTSERKSEQIIKSISREEQIALVSLGIQGIDKQSSNAKLFGKKVAGTDREVLIQYGFDAKLGVEGKDVKIAEVDENKLRVTIPEFIFIGYDNLNFEVAAENNGILSWTTPEINEVDMVNTILNDDAKTKYVKSNQDLLKEQTEFFYSSIITSADPDIQLEFEYAEAPINAQ